MTCTIKKTLKETKKKKNLNQFIKTCTINLGTMLLMQYSISQSDSMNLITMVRLMAVIIITPITKIAVSPNNKIKHKSMLE